MKKLPVGTIVYAKYTYGGEICHYNFYKIEGYTEKSVKITKLETEILYDKESDYHYYDDPYTLVPRKLEGRYVIDTDVYNVSRKLHEGVNGEMTFKPEDYFVYQGPWLGIPLKAYNYH